MTYGSSQGQSGLLGAGWCASRGRDAPSDLTNRCHAPACGTDPSLWSTSAITLGQPVGLSCDLGCGGAVSGVVVQRRLQQVFQV